MDSIRSALIERLDKRIEHLKKGQRHLKNFRLRDRRLDQAVARLVRLRERTRHLGQAEKTP